MPLITVLLPVFNAGPYLGAAIDSILTQTEEDFELLIIDDHSDDNSLEIIGAYTDHRIRLIKKPRRKGLIDSLNLGIDQARGLYIARMDGDDICHPDRFKIQMDYFQSNPGVVMVCSPIMGMTPAGKQRDVWPADFQNRNPVQIRNKLVWENCISHPTVMIRTDILRKYRYSFRQKGSEDWDLWLRFSRDGLKIVKTEQILLHYRIHEQSVTVKHNLRNAPQLKSAQVKWRFFLSSLKEFRLNVYVLKTLFTVGKDLGYHLKTRSVPTFLRKLKWMFTLDPIRAVLQFQDLRRVLREYKGRHFYFFPYTHLGGAEKVHAAICRATVQGDPIVFITGLHNKGGFEETFGRVRLLRIEAAAYHPLTAARSLKLISKKIHDSENPVVFGCNNRFFYDLVPSLPGDARCLDLIHDVDYASEREEAEKYLPAFLRMDVRIFVSREAKRKTLQFYESAFVDDVFAERLKVIYNGVQPVGEFARTFNPPYKVIYVGRDSPEKRVHLVRQLAHACEVEQLPFEFHLVGPSLKKGQNANIYYHGELTDESSLSEQYALAQFVIIASSSEGFPLALAEGMMHGCIPVSTAVGDIPFHLRGAGCGWLNFETKEELIVEHFVAQFKKYAASPSELPGMSERARQYARVHFSKEMFNDAYRSLLLSN